jgi:hypothetical protein
LPPRSRWHVLAATLRLRVDPPDVNESGPGRLILAPGIRPTDSRYRSVSATSALRSRSSSRTIISSATTKASTTADHRGGDAGERERHPRWTDRASRTARRPLEPLLPPRGVAVAHAVIVHVADDRGASPTSSRLAGIRIRAAEATDSDRSRKVAIGPRVSELRVPWVPPRSRPGTGRDR